MQNELSSALGTFSGIEKYNTYPDQRAINTENMRCKPQEHT